MPFDISAAMNDAARTRLAERELEFRQRLAKAGQLQELREYEDRKAQEAAAASRTQNFNRLAAIYLGESRVPNLSTQFRNQLAQPAAGPQATGLPPTNPLAQPQPSSAQSGGMPSSPVQAGRGAPLPKSGLNWSNLNRDELMQELIEADPQRANEIRGWGDEQWRNEALTNYRKVEQVFGSSTPKLLAQQLLPDVVEGLVEDGHSWQDLTDDQIRTVSKALMAELSPLAGIDMNSALETVVGQDGKPILVPRSQAAGKQPYEKGSQPSSYEEFVLAQGDPEFKQFLRERRGKGISMTMPDGTVVEIGGDGGSIGPGDLSGPTKNKLQESLVQAADELDRLNSIGASFDPKFLTIQGRALGAGLKLKDISGGLFGQMTPQEQDFLRRYSTFRADSGKNLSAILNRLSGAAISPAEGERLKKGIPNEEDSPTQFQAKYTSAVKDVTRATMRANWALKNGIGVRSVDQLAQVMPLDAIDQVYEQRANQIWQQLGGTPETKKQAIQQTNQEFGLAR